MAWLIPLASIGIILYLVWARLRRKTGGTPTRSEYWVFVTEAKAPPMEKIMDAMLAANPHNRPGQPCITKREGLLFSDIRLHIATALRSRNPNIFRPDLMFDSVSYDAAGLAALNQAQAVLQLRYVSENPTQDRRHLQFMPHLADAVSRISGAVAVLDTMTEVLVLANEFTTMLSKHPDQENASDPVRVVWSAQEDGAMARTLGLRKVGLPELRTDVIPFDETTTVEPILEDIATQMWTHGHSGSAQLERFGQTFRIEIDPPTLGEAHVSIRRIHSS